MSTRGGGDIHLWLNMTPSGRAGSLSDWRKVSEAVALLDQTASVEYHAGRFAKYSDVRGHF